MSLRDAKFSLLLVCRDLVRLLVLISLVYLIDKDSALRLTTKFAIVCTWANSLFHFFCKIFIQKTKPRRILKLKFREKFKSIGKK